MPQQRLARDLQKACQILFNTDIRLATDFLPKLDETVLKHAYRKKAFETHPDRSKALGKNEAQMIQKFKEVTIAYEILKPVVEGEQKVHIVNINTKKPKPSPYTNREKKPKDPPTSTRHQHFNREHRKGNHFYKGPVPHFDNLPLSKFLYYSGKIPWKTYIDSIMWEKKQRPLFGEIAFKWKFLTNEDIRTINENKIYPEKFGEFAVRKGYLSSFQQMAVLGRQRILEPSPGQFFVTHGYFDQEEINEFINSAKTYNKTKTFAKKAGSRQ